MNSAWLTVDFLAGTVGGLVASIAVARVLGPVKVGYFSYLLWAVSTAAAVAGAGIPAAARKFAAEYFGAVQQGMALAVIDRAWNVQRIVACLAALVGLAIVCGLLKEEQLLYGTAAALCILPTMLIEIPTSGAAAAQKYRASVIPSITAAAVNLAGVALSLIFRWDLLGLSASLLVARLLDLFLRRKAFERIIAGYRRAESVPALEPGLGKRMLRFCAGAAAVQLLNLIVWDRSEVFFLGRYCDVRQVAFYAVPFNIITQVLLIVRGFASSATAHLMNLVGSDKEGAKALTAVLLRYVAMIAIPLLLGLAALARPLVKLLYGPEFYPAAAILSTLAIFAAARAAITPVLLMFSAFEMQGRALAVMTVCALVNLLLDWLLIPGNGASGAALANGIAQSAGVVLLWLTLARGLRVHLRWRSMLAIVIAAASAVVPAALLAFILPPWPALLGGSLASILLYVPLLRAARAIDSDDRQRLANLAPLVPLPLRRYVFRLAAWLG